MEKFLLNMNYDYGVRLFGGWHWILVGLVVGAIWLVIRNRKRIAGMSQKQKVVLRVGFALLLLVNLLLRRIPMMMYGLYDWRYNLDLNFCNFLAILFMIYGFTGNRKIYSLCFYMSFAGPLLSILFPCDDFSWKNYDLYAFLIGHHLIFVFNFIFMYMERYKYNQKDFRNAFMFLVIYFMLIYGFDILTNTNYLAPNDYINPLVKKGVAYKVLNQVGILKYLVYYLVIVGMTLVGRGVLKGLQEQTK